MNGLDLQYMGPTVTACPSERLRPCKRGAPTTVQRCERRRRPYDGAAPACCQGSAAMQRMVARCAAKALQGRGPGAPALVRPGHLASYAIL
jgi:hypothetical protein